MAQPFDAGANTSIKQGYLESAVSGVENFSKGVFRGAIENPINGVLQLTNHIAGARLPELHVVDAETIDHTICGNLGEMVGSAADVFAMTLATGRMGGSGYLGSSFKMAAVGAAYTGIFQPSDPNSKNFYADRASNAAVAAATFGAMGAGAAYLDSTGRFAVSAARSFGGDLAYGALSGAVGGVAHSEANAIFKEGRALPTANQFISDLGSYTAFGAAYGGIGHVVSVFTNPAPEYFRSKHGALQVYADSQGQPVKVAGQVPALNQPGVDIKFTSTKMTNGVWSSSAESSNGIDALPPAINNVVRNNNGSFTLDGGDVTRTFSHDGTYVRRDLAAEREAVANQKLIEKTWGTQVKDETGVRSFDPKGRLRGLEFDENQAAIHYGENGDINSVSVGGPQNSKVTFSKNGNGYDVWMKDQKYSWQGSIKVTTATSGASGGLEFKPANGESFTYGPNSAENFMKAAESQATYVPGGTGRPILRVSENGDISMTGGTSRTTQAIVNQQEVTAGTTVHVKPGDLVQLKSDVGDRFAIWETKDLTWQNVDGRPQLQGIDLKPNTVLDINS